MTQFLKDYGGLIAVFLSPIVAVMLTVWYQNRGDKQKTKRELFLTLFAYRGSPLHVKFVDCLNQIDIVFLDNQRVINAWHQHLSSLNQTGLTDPVRTWEVQRMNLLSEMAVAVGYESLNSAAILEPYYPEGHLNYLNNENNFRDAQLLFYQKNSELADKVVKRMKDQDEGNYPLEQ